MAVVVAGVKIGADTSTRHALLLAAVVASAMAAVIVVPPFGGEETTMTSLPAQPGETRLSYGICIDAGSSGSRLLVYRWARGRFFSTVEQVHAQKMRPGLTGIAREAVRGAVDRLVDKAVSIVPNAAHGETPIHLMATAGLRLVPFSLRASIMEEVRHVLSASPFRFHPSFARVISGEDEARFDWYAANLLARTFATLVEPPPAPPASSVRGQSALALARPYVAAADLGGASTQIAHPAPSWDEDDALVRRGYTTERLGPTQVQDLYAVSRLGYGLNEAFRKLLGAAPGGGGSGGSGGAACVGEDKAAASDAPAGAVDATALAAGAGDERGQGARGPSTAASGEEPSQGASDHVSEATAAPVVPPGAAACVPRGAEVRVLAASGELVVKGQGDFDGCRAALAPLLEAAKGDVPPDGLDGHDVRPVPLVLFDNFAKLGRLVVGRSGLGMDKPLHVDELERGAQSLCEETAPRLREAHPEEGDPAKWCFLGAYATALLREVYHAGTGRPLFIADVVDSFDANWALGAVAVTVLAEERQVVAAAG